MSKEIELHTCPECESEYKLVYDRTDTSGLSKFCPFCGADTEDEDDYNLEDEEN